MSPVYGPVTTATRYTRGVGPLTTTAVSGEPRPTGVSPEGVVSAPRTTPRPLPLPRIVPRNRNPGWWSGVKRIGMLVSRLVWTSVVPRLDWTRRCGGRPSTPLSVALRVVSVPFVLDRV